MLAAAFIASRPLLMSPLDRLLSTADNALRTLAGASVASRPCPQPPAPARQAALDESQRRLSGALMRVNHVGEVCAQALYSAQAVATRDPALRAHYEQAARDETDHLAWTQQRLRELGARTSLLNPLWYAGAFGIGFLAGRVSDRLSLGFVVETERQVERHLQGHLERLPAADHASLAIVEQMKEDEASHAVQAEQAGALALPAPVRALMRAAARVMTGTAHYV
jgi:ubiquinone biosynthesis monooxygenase Coq7